MNWKFLTTFIKDNKYYSLLLDKDTGDVYIYCYEDNIYERY